MLSIYIAIDLETTGLDTERDAIIEIGAVKFRGKEVLDEFGTLINPGRVIPPEITELTGISDEDVAFAPDLLAVLPDLARFVGDRPVVGHNVSFDLGFLRRQLVLLNNQGLDTFRLATILAPDAERYSLGQLANLLGIDQGSAHRALDDARATHHLFVALFERALSLPTHLLEELVQLGERIQWPATEFFRQALKQAAQEAFHPAAAPPATRGAADNDLLLLDASEGDLPLEPEPARQSVPIDELAGLLEEGGAFARQFPGYEYRPQQVAMLRAVAAALNHGQHLMVEAPTGVGKSLAYLIPAAYWAAKNQERVVISTNTINLQEQLYRKDIPDLLHVLPLDFQAAVLKGRSHYICPARLAAMRRVGPASYDEMDVLARVLVWLPETQDGDGDALFLPTPEERGIWRNLSADFEGCDPERCQEFRRGGCFFYRARKAAEAAHLLIVNHALLLADVAVQSRALPDYHYLIVDEAHHLEAATTNGLSFTTDRHTIWRLWEEIGRRRGLPGEAAARATPPTGLLGESLHYCRRERLDRRVVEKMEEFVSRIAQAVTQAQHELEQFFEQLEYFVQEQREGQPYSNYSFRLRVTPAERIQPAWDQVEISWDRAAAPLFAVVDGLERLIDALDELEALGARNLDDLRTGLVSAARRLAEVRAHLQNFVAQPDHQTIYWVETGPGQKPLSIHAAPLHVGPLVEEHLFHKKEAVILTSATLRTDHRFDYLRERLNAWDADELAVDSPFDYESSTLVYVVDDIPGPGQPGYQRAVEQGMATLFQATRGRALALFTSYSQLRATAQAIEAPLRQKEISVYAQGQGLSRNQLLENFRGAERAVLMGTRSFWEGVDVPGEALSCLAIAKLPFNVPSDPVFAARSETFDAPFLEYAVPEAVLRFLQGFGRLIRTRTDRGIVVLFDQRLLSKSYGRIFLDSLPGPTIRRGPSTRLSKAANEWLDGGGRSQRS
ncbi:MAG: DEAD/DEAH box helicase [Anaerolineae bacterium]|nr:DEAD/DEAH box helicase [Anaerolineae bacterium]